MRDLLEELASDWEDEEETKRRIKKPIKKTIEKPIKKTIEKPIKKTIEKPIKKTIVDDRYDERDRVFAGLGYSGEPIPYFEMLDHAEESKFFHSMDNRQRLYYINYTVNDITLAHHLLIHYHDLQMQRMIIDQLDAVESRLSSISFKL